AGLRVDDLDQPRVDHHDGHHGSSVDIDHEVLHDDHPLNALTRASLRLLDDLVRVHRAAREAPQLGVPHGGGRAGGVPGLGDDVDAVHEHEVLVLPGA